MDERGSSRGRRYVEEVVEGDGDLVGRDGALRPQHAEAAAEGWRKTSSRERSEILRRWFELMRAHAEELALLISLENGKALPDARGRRATAATHRPGRRHTQYLQFRAGSEHR